MSDVSQGPGWWKAPGEKVHALLGRLLAALALVFAVALPVGAVFSFTTQVAGASTDTVTNCDDSGAGSLRQTVADASAGDTIDFEMSPACSLITLTSGDIEYTQNLTIDGPGASTLAVSGNNESPIFVGDGASETTVSGLTLEDAKGAISAGGSLTVTDANFSDNSESAGGAISFNGNGTFTVTGSTFTHNASTDSGGAIEEQGSNTTTFSVTDSTFTDNTAGMGGGAIDNYGGTLTVTGSTFSNNSAENGGAVSIDSCNDLCSHAANITDSSFTGNTATSAGGGAVSGNYDQLSISGSNFSENTATAAGGGAIANAGIGGSVTISDTTVAHNSATDPLGLVEEGEGGGDLQLRHRNGLRDRQHGVGQHRHRIWGRSRHTGRRGDL